MLKVVKNDTNGHGYCGPFVVCAITGKPLSKILDDFREVRYGPWWKRRFSRRPLIKGTYNWEIIQVLGKYGWKMTPVGMKTDNPTLAQWMRGRSPADRERIHVLIIGHDPHCVTVRGNMFCDTFTKGKPVSIGRAPHRRKRVSRVFRVEK